MAKKLTESAKTTTVNQRLYEAEQSLLDKYVNEIVGLMKLNHFEKYYFDYDIKPKIMLPLLPFGNIYDTDQNVVLDRSKPIYQDDDNNKPVFFWIWSCPDYGEVELSSITIKDNDVWCKPIINQPHKKEHFEHIDIEMTKDGLMKMRTLPFPYKAFASVMWNLLDELPKI